VARRENAIDQIPAKSQPPRYVEKSIEVYVVTRGLRYLVQQRPEGAVNAGFWEFPNSENGTSFSIPKSAQPIATAHHTITRYRIKLNAYSIRSNRTQGKWCTLNELRKMPFTAGHRKLLKGLL
jgi:adenine-specific DNA glycosylase